MESETTASPTEQYEKRIAFFSEQAKTFDARSRRYSNLRLAIVLLGVTFVFVIPKNNAFGVSVLAGILLLLVILFAIIAFQHHAVEEAFSHAQAMTNLNAEGKARTKRDWKALPNRLAPSELVNGMLARDMDLFGPISLFQLICTANTWEGRKAVAEILVRGIEQDRIPNRQAAVKELAAKLDFRQELESTTLPLRNSTLDSGALLGSLDSDSAFVERRLARLFCVISPFALVSLFALNLIGYLPRWPWGLVMTLNYAVSFLRGKTVRKNLKSAMNADRTIGHFIRAFRCVMAESLISPELVELKELLGQAVGKMEKLAGLISLSKFPGGFILDVLFLWNLNLARAFSRWWSANGGEFGRWQRAIGRIEEICSFASLLHDNASWTFPNVTSSDRILGQALGHPMIPEHVRVDNDTKLGPPGRILMVTGSNMSGKTTLLRSIGTNVLLAKAGGPVCAKKFELPWVEMVTSIRSMDSISDGVSLFMAELSSIKVVMEAAHRATQKGTHPVLYLLDEVLLGTNIDERKVITSGLILNLLKCKAIGAMSTHDLSLLHIPEIADFSDKVHFQERFVVKNGKAEMTFDYQIREGEAQSRNAIALMKHIGLELE
jgi:MutS domain V